MSERVRPARAQRLRDLFTAIPARLSPAERTAAALAEIDWRPEATVIVAAGKAAPAMAAGAVTYLEAHGLALAGGTVIGPAGTPASAVARLAPESGPLSNAEAPVPATDALLAELFVELFGRRSLSYLVGSHPVPDQRSVAAAEAALQAVAGAPGNARVLALISGGASALMAMPAPGLRLEDKIAALRAVAAAGVDIGALNTVRKHLSAIKGGQLMARSPVAVTTLVASDVIGDDMTVVGSGPTLPDPSTYRLACDIVASSAGWSAVPRAVRKHLEAGAAGRLPETPAHGRPGDHALLIAGTGALLDAAVAAARAAGMAGRIFARDLVGDVTDVARRIAAHAQRVEAAGLTAPTCFVGGGEPTIALPAAPGVGGRAQQVALLVARDIAGAQHVSVLVAGSDGIDGNSAAAGAVVDGGTWEAVLAAGMDPERALARCDAGTALAAVGATVITGPTGINHADLVLVGAGLAEPRDACQSG